MTLADAGGKLEDWLKHDNDVRSDSAIGYKDLRALHNPGGEADPNRNCSRTKACNRQFKVRSHVMISKGSICSGMKNWWQA
jgi:hypothetical protein